MTTGLTPLQFFLIGFITSFLTSLTMTVISHKLKKKGAKKNEIL